MCGLAGIINRKGLEVKHSILESMTQSLHHRGPDARGLRTQGCVGLGHTRLAIVDISGGSQPMSSADGSVTIVYNGEIYNFPELKQKLTKQGLVFQTHCDTEILLHLWQEKGPEMLHDLEGMFAFALYDSRRQQVFLAVDRFGQKPLYYVMNQNLLAFASEPRALQHLPEQTLSLDPGALHHYLSFLAVSPPRTIYKEMNRLAGGRQILYNLKTNEIKESLWYHLNSGTQINISYVEAQEQLRHLLKQAVRKRLMSDVPLGAFLSGGLDSAIVVGLMQELTQESIKTFTIGSNEVLWNESDLARNTADHLKTQHHEKIVEPCDTDLFFSLVNHLGEPFADSSFLPTALVSEFAREHVTVALSGDAADEAFGGYNRYRALELAQKFDWLPKTLRRTFLKLAEKLTPGSAEDRHLTGQLKRFFRISQDEGLQRYFNVISHFSEEEKHNLYTDDFFENITHLNSLRILQTDHARAKAKDPIKKIMALEVSRYLQDDILVKVDRASMKHSLEVRSPFIDHQVVEFAFSLPQEYKRKDGQGKRILKDTFQDFLSPKNTNQPKRGFAVPLGRWLRGPMKSFAEDLLTDTTAKQRGIFEPSMIQRLLTEHQNGKTDHGQKIWALCVFEAWCRNQK